MLTSQWPEELSDLRICDHSTQFRSAVFGMEQRVETDAATLDDNSPTALGFSGRKVLFSNVKTPQSHLATRSRLLVAGLDTYQALWLGSVQHRWNLAHPSSANNGKRLAPPAHRPLDSALVRTILGT